MSMPFTTQQCSKCKRSLPIAMFDRDSSKASGYRSQCKPCRRPATELSDQQREMSDQELRQTVNRNALLRLVHNHRAEFESLVNGELIRLKAERDGVSVEQAWASLA